MQDVINEAVKWGGKVLLHQEVALPATGRSTGGGACGQQQQGAADRSASTASARSGSISSLLPAPLVAGSFLTPPAGPLAPAAVKLAGVMASPAAVTLTAAAGRQQLSLQQQGSTAAAGDGPPMRVSGSQILLGAAAAAEAAGSLAENAAGDVITAPVDVRPGAAVVPFWEAVDLDALGLRRSSSGGQPGGSGTPAAASNNAVDARPTSSSSGKLPLATCLEVAKALQATGLHLTYRRIPLSRERTPVPSDLSDMLKQMLALPAGVGPLDRSAPGGGASENASTMMQEAAAAAAAWSSGSQPWTAAQQEQQQAAQQPSRKRSIVHLVVSRTATGSSARFASAAFATFLAQHTASESRAAASGAPNSPTITPASRRRGAGAAAAAAAPPAAPANAAAPAGLAGSSLANGSSSAGAAAVVNSSDGGGSDAGSPKSPAAKRLRRTVSDLGEYRVVMSLVRLLPGGMEVKNAVDSAVDRCSAIGNLRSDIAVCKHTAEAAPQGSSNDPGSTAWAARQLGVHYLKRYFLLIAFRWVMTACSTGACRPCNLFMCVRKD